jgi:hypothetical protein
MNMKIRAAVVAVLEAAILAAAFVRSWAEGPVPPGPLLAPREGRSFGDPPMLEPWDPVPRPAVRAVGSGYLMRPETGYYSLAGQSADLRRGVG